MPATTFFVVGVVFLAVGWFLHQQGANAIMIGGQFEFDYAVMVSMIGVLFLLFPVVDMFYLKPLGDILEQRNNELESTFAEAEALRTQMTDMKSDYERRLADTEAKAREQIQGQIREAQELRKTLMAEATQRADEMVKRAQEEIAAERDRALAGIRIQVADLSLMAAERILRENMDDERNRRLVNEFLDTVEVPSA
ncbi:MAG: F0F1 ATP synthase subunit B [Fimbriimonadaceae bacterium]|nr:F0F1 ATP synthase subunit B [Fimbriimonadaceae bacterium]QYK56928.1 MAG: F0F1 ATP synthase subunit B [Fimbriimonadaceae bacterium]